MKRQLFLPTLMALAVPMLVGCGQQPTSTLTTKDRAEIDDKYKWNLTDVYASVDDWRKDMETVAPRIEALKQYEGRLGGSAKTLKEFCALYYDIDMKLSRLYTYAFLRADQNVSDTDNQALVKEIEQVWIECDMASSFVRPELSAIPEKTIKAYMAAEPELRQYNMAFDRIIRGRKHTLSNAEEALMSKVSMMGDPVSNAFSVFTDAEMPHATIELSDGSTVELDNAAFLILRASACRADRETAVHAYWQNFAKFEATIGELMNGNIRKRMFYAKARNFESCLSAALDNYNIPTDVYRSLIDNVNKNLPAFHRYLTLKKRLLGVDRLKYSDLYAPATGDVDMKYTYEEAQELVLDAVKPLGEDYAAVVKRAFNERWIDVMPNKGKASGAYSHGGIYEAHPYILMNYDERYNSVGTLIHELGHTMHSYYSNATQPYALHDYSTFVAEVASTCNEALLNNLMLQRITDPKQKLCLLMEMLDNFKGTLFRQTQFAEFELAMCEMAEQGKPLTGKVLTELYGQITRKYYGHDAGICLVDDDIMIEWASVPHFYIDFYVYQYSTSFVASQALSEMILAGNPNDVDAYLGLLKAGDSKYPIDELIDAGVNMLSPEPFDKAIAAMNALMDMVEELL